MATYHTCASGSMAASPLLSGGTRLVVGILAAAVFAGLWLGVFPGKEPRLAAAPAAHAVTYVTLPRVEVTGRKDDCDAAAACAPQAVSDAGEQGHSQVNLRQ